jgi:hypothetical protein
MSQEKVVYIEPGYEDDDPGTLHVVELREFVKMRWGDICRELNVLASQDKKTREELVQKLKTDFGLNDVDDVKAAGKVAVVPNTPFIFINQFGGCRELELYNLDEFIGLGEKLYREVYPTDEVLAKVAELKKKAAAKKKKIDELKRARAIDKAKKVLAAASEGGDDGPIS